MIILSETAPQPRWETITTAGGDFKVHITPPTYEQWVRDRGQLSLADEILTRLECVTGWRDVFQQMPNGGKAEIPFSRDLLAVMFRNDRGVFDQIGKLVRPLFDGPTKVEAEDAEKNSVRPSTETEPMTA